jgi:hypothetical protein
MSRFSSMYGAYEIDSLPGQCQVAVCHSLVVPEEHRDILHYDFAVCTVAAGNAPQKRILAKAGWRCLATFRNRRSCETTELWGRGEPVEDQPNE